MVLTVKELIKRLERFDEDLPVYALAAYNFYPITYSHIVNKQVILKTADIGGELSEPTKPISNNIPSDFDPDPIFPDVA